MSVSHALHPADETLHAYGLGKLDDASAGSINRHLEECSDCRRRVAEPSSDSFLGRLRDAQGRPGSQSPVVSSENSQPGRVPDRRSPIPARNETLPLGLANHPDYEILRELGRGGLGVVYLAQNKLMGRQEILKVVSGYLVNRGEALDRFLVEIRNAARLHHPNIVTAYTALRIGPDLVLGMEYVEGFDLSRVVKAKGPLPIALACNYVHQVASGLQHAHEQGMVHRDVKPGNLMLARMGNKAVIKILDFGLAKVQHEQSPVGTLTQAGQLLGTPSYMAPEQTNDPRHVDIRADIYSLGCTFYYLLTGNPPFQGANLYDILQAHQSMEALPLNLARPEVPVQLAVIVATMMSKDPERRFQTPGEVEQALAPFLKKEIPASRGTMPEISLAEAASRQEPSRATVPAATQTAAIGPGSSAPAREISAAPAPAGSGWDTLIEFKQEADLSEEVRALREARRSPAWLWPAAACVPVLLGLAVFLGMKIEAGKNRKNVEPATPIASRTKAEQPDPRKSIAPPPVREERPSPLATRPKPAPEPIQSKTETIIALGGSTKGAGPLDRDRRDESDPPAKVQPEETKREPNPPVADMNTKPDDEPVPEDGSPEAVLSKRGLKRSGKYYVVPTEFEFASVWRGVVPFYNLMDTARAELMQALQVVAYVRDLDDTRINLINFIQDLNLAMGGASRDQRAVLQNQLREANFNLNNVVAELAKARTRLVSPAKMQQLQDVFMKRREDFLAKSSEVRPIRQKMKAEYDRLKTDDDVVNALKVLKERKKVNVSLGPSDVYNRLARQLAQAEEAVSLDPDAYRRKKKSTRLKEAPKGNAGAMSTKGTSKE